MVIKGKKIFSEEGIFRNGNVEITGEKISRIVWGDDCENKEENIVDVGEMYVIPGLIDIHFHGCMGVDFCDGSVHAMDVIAEYELQNGITGIVPATMTLSRTSLVK